MEVLKENIKSILEVVSLDFVGITTTLWLLDSMTLSKSIVALFVGLSTLYLTIRKISNLSSDAELKRIEIKKARLELIKLENELRIK